MFLWNQWKKIVLYKKYGYSWGKILARVLASRSGRIPGETLHDFLMINLYCILHKSGGKQKNVNATEGIFVIETGVLGDVMLALGSLQKLYQYTCETGLSLTVCCNSFISMILKEYGGMRNVLFLTYENRDAVTVEELKKIRNTLARRRFRYVLRRDSHALGTYIAAASNASEKIYYSYFLDRQPRSVQSCNRKIFQQIRNYKDGAFIPDIWKSMLLAIGVENYATEQGMLRVNRSLSDLKPYVLLCPESSSRNKCMEIALCEAVVRYVQSQDRVIKISVRGDHSFYTRQLRNLAAIAGIEILEQMTTDSFVSLVAGASGVIGCDSGSIHLAAACHVPSVCIAGCQEKGIFFPYQYENVLKDAREPVYVQSAGLDCENCSIRGQFTKLNRTCMKMVANGQSLYCIARMEEQAVLEKIAEMLESEFTT